MSAKHTPGPWQRIGNKVFALTPSERQEPGWPTEINRFGCYIQRENREPCGAPDDELEANARLIAAAPELLEALQMLMPQAPNAWAENDPYSVAMWDNAAAAIAKATGKESQTSEKE